MIAYRPLDGDASDKRIDYRPRTCFLMTQLGGPIPGAVTEARDRLQRVLGRQRIGVIDAESVVTGKDFLLKIWELILSVPLGIAIIDKDMSRNTFANIFYEIGMMQVMGKETLVVKTAGTQVPSDFVRTEYIEFDPSRDGFERKVRKFLASFDKLAVHYQEMAALLAKNPLLAMDYLRRAYLISPKPATKKRAKRIFRDANFGPRAKNSVEMLLIDF